MTSALKFSNILMKFHRELNLKIFKHFIEVLRTEPYVICVSFKVFSPKQTRLRIHLETILRLLNKYIAFLSRINMGGENVRLSGTLDKHRLVHLLRAYAERWSKYFIENKLWLGYVPTSEIQLLYQIYINKKKTSTELHHFAINRNRAQIHTLGPEKSLMNSAITLST